MFRVLEIERQPAPVVLGEAVRVVPYGRAAEALQVAEVLAGLTVDKPAWSDERLNIWRSNVTSRQRKFRPKKCMV